MIKTHASHLAERPPIFAAPFIALLAGIAADVPRYQREKTGVSFARNSAAAPAPTAAAIALQSRIIDVLKHGARVLDEFPERNVMDATTIAFAIASNRNTVYKALYMMLEEGRAGRTVHNRMCVEWVTP